MSTNKRSQNEIKNVWFIITILLMFSLLLPGCSSKSGPYTVGLVIESAAAAPIVEGFETGMTELGYVEGEDIVYIESDILGSEVEAIDNEIKRLLDEKKVDMLFVISELPALEAKKAVEGTDIPVIFAPAANVVEIGLVESISHPGGNLTGIQAGGEVFKSMEYLMRIVPDAKKIYIPYNPVDNNSSILVGVVTEIATQFNVEIVPGEVHSSEEAATAIENLPEDIDAIYRVLSSTLEQNNALLGQAAIKRGLPMSGMAYLDEAALFTLAIDAFGVGKQAARLASQIQQGVKPGDLPVEAAEYYFAVSLKTAEKIGVEIPDDMLQQADDIFR